MLEHVSWFMAGVLIGLLVPTSYGNSNKIVDELRALRKVLEDKNIHKGD